MWDLTMEGKGMTVELTNLPDHALVYFTEWTDEWHAARKEKYPDMYD